MLAVLGKRGYRKGSVEKHYSKRLEEKEQEGGREKHSAQLTDRGKKYRGWRGRESISVCVPRRVLPTHQPHDHRGLMGTLNPEALQSLILL